MKRFMALLLVFILVIVSLVGCGDRTKNAEEGNDNTESGEPAVLRMLYDVENTTLNYLESGREIEHAVACNMVDGLVEFDNHSNIRPAMAESWEVSEDGLVWTFHIRKGQYWYDCAETQIAEVTADDWVSGLKLVCDPRTDSGTYDQVKIIKGAEDYFNAMVEGKEADFSTVGVKAIDKYTLEYTLNNPTPYFLGGLVYVCWLPVYGPLVDSLMTPGGETSSSFGTEIDKIYSNGAFILTEWEPQVKQTFVKNKNYWDAEHVYIDRIEKSYNAEAATLAPTMVLRNENDFAPISNDILDDWKANHADYLSKGREDSMWNYFYAFDFRPCYDDEYKPVDWMKAVLNSNFRHAFVSAFDREFVVQNAVDQEGYATLIQDTICPRGSCFTGSGTDFADMPAFDGIENNYYNEEKALEYKAKAMEELQAKGVTFPVNVLLSYQSGEKNYENECVIVKQQLEKVLGTDFINIVLWAGPSENFLSETRSAGKYSFMRVRWGADYIDPQTWTDPFNGGVDPDTGIHIGNSYNRWEILLDDDTCRWNFNKIQTNSMPAHIEEILSDPDLKNVRDILKQYYELVEMGKAEGVDLDKRFDYFAQAEALLINNAMVMPCYCGAAKYQATKLNIFEGAYAPCGYAKLTYKGMKLQDHFITMKEYEKNMKDWEDGKY